MTKPFYIGDLVVHQGSIKRVVHSYPAGNSGVRNTVELVDDEGAYTFASYSEVEHALQEVAR